MSGENLTPRRGSTSPPQRRMTGGKRRSTTEETLSFSVSETSASTNRRLHDRTLIFGTRFHFALVIIGLQTGVVQLTYIFTQVEKYGGILIFLTIFAAIILVSLPHMVHQMFYGFYNKYGFIKFWNIAPVGFGIGLTMALYSVYECVMWAAIAGLLILHICYIPFRSISERTTCEKIERPEGVICYDSQSKLSETSCELTTFPELEYYRKISYRVQRNGGINAPWFICCSVVWLIVFVMVSQGFRRLKNVLIRLPVCCLIFLTLLVAFSYGAQKTLDDEHKEDIFLVEETPTNYSIIWLVWHAIRVVQIPLGTLIQLGSYAPSGSQLLADVVMILLFVYFYNFAFAYFAHCCLAWIEINFVGINHHCLASDGMTVLFASVPTAVSFLTMGNFWLFVFYGIFAVKTITEMVIILNATMNAMSETFHWHRHRQQIVALICIVALLFDLPITMTDSEIFFQRIYHFVELIVDLCIVGASSLIVVGFYTLSKVFDDMHFAYNAEPVMFLKFVSYLSPVIMIFVWTGFTTITSKWREDPLFVHNHWVGIFVACTVCILLLPIPGFAMYMYVVSLTSRQLSAMLQPTESWGPREPDVKRARLTFNPRYELEYRSKKPCAHNCLLNNLRIKIEVEKRDLQRREFFLNVLRDMNYVEWDDIADWSCRGEIISKTRVQQWSGDFGKHPISASENSENIKASFSTMVDGNRRDTKKRPYPDEETNADDDHAMKYDVNFGYQKDGEERGNRDVETRPESSAKPDVIIPADVNSRHTPIRRVRLFDGYHVAHRPLKSPRYGRYHPTCCSPERRRTRKEIAPIELAASIDRRRKEHPNSESFQTKKGWKRVQKLLRSGLPWKKKSTKTRNRCVETSCGNRPTNRASFKKSQSSGSSSETSNVSSESEKWP